MGIVSAKQGGLNLEISDESGVDSLAFLSSSSDWPCCSALKPCDFALLKNEDNSLLCWSCCTQLPKIVSVQDGRWEFCTSTLLVTRRLEMLGSHLC